MRKFGIHDSLNQVLFDPPFPHRAMPIVKESGRVMYFSLLANVLHSVPQERVFWHYPAILAMVVQVFGLWLKVVPAIPKHTGLYRVEAKVFVRLATVQLAR